jgi:ABC-type nitrate/sulfonate/bicarbonate transport system substrate-binding protein
MDLAWENTQVVYASIGKGAQIVEIMDRSANANLLLTKASLETCSDLDGKSIAVPGVTSPGTLILRAYVEDTCPGASPQLAVVSGSRNRYAALLGGTVDGAIQQLDTLLKAERERPGEFHALVRYVDYVPEIQMNTCVAGRLFVEQHPQAIRDIIQAVMVGRRSVQDEASLEEAIIHYLEYEPEDARRSAEAYVALGTWDFRGEYSMENVQATLEFLQAGGVVDAGLEANDIADLSHYQDALAELVP